VRLAAGSHLLRLEALTPAHLGSSAGESALDRPCQKDAAWGLPFLPDSALKGVWAGRLGDSFEREPNEGRERIFGSPDRAGAPGRPARFAAGNGDLLCFPLPGTAGAPAWVFPALSAARFLRLDPTGEKPGFPAILGTLETSQQPLVFGWPEVPRAGALSGFQPLSLASARDEAEPLATQLLRLAGAAAPPGALLLVSNRHARRLWLAAAERRTLTALDGATRTVRDGTLREVELIPAGTVFLSLLTCEEDLDDLPWPERFQVGAWEGLGFGWMKAALVSAESRVGTMGEGTGVRGPARNVREDEVLMAMHRAVRSLAAEPADLRQAVKSAVGGFGPRAQFSGLEAALAFELAKAKPEHREPKLDARAHRWLLSALLFPDPSPPRPDRAMPEARAWLGEDPFQAIWMSDHRDLIFLRWQWLRRFTEFGLEV